MEPVTELVAMMLTILCVSQYFAIIFFSGLTFQELIGKYSTDIFFMIRKIYLKRKMPVFSRIYLINSKMIIK